MTTHRRYYFEHPGPWEYDGPGHRKIKDLLEFQAEKRWWYNEPRVEGEPYGRMSFSFTVSATDQWRCHRRAMALAIACYRKLGLPAGEIPIPLWEPLERETNRGRFRLPETPPEPEDDVEDLFQEILKRSQS